MAWILHFPAEPHTSASEDRRDQAGRSGSCTRRGGVACHVTDGKTGGRRNHKPLGTGEGRSGSLLTQAWARRAPGSAAPGSAGLGCASAELPMPRCWAPLASLFPSGLPVPIIKSFTRAPRPGGWECRAHTRRDAHPPGISEGGISSIARCREGDLQRGRWEGPGNATLLENSPTQGPTPAGGAGICSQQHLGAPPHTHTPARCPR